MRLFPRLFLLLLASLLTVAAVFGWLSQRWESERNLSQRTISIVRSLGSEAAATFLREGPRGLEAWLRGSMRAYRFRGFLLDEDGFNLLPRPLPRELLGPAREAVLGQHAVELSRPPYFIMVAPVSQGGERFYWLTIQRLTPGQVQEGRRQQLWLGLALALVAVLLLSLLLSRLALRPLRELKDSAARLGAGDLQARPSSGLLARGDEFGDLARAFAGMGERIESLVQSHKQLLRDVSHELRSPLARLEVALELARQSAGSAAASELDRIELEAHRLDALIGEILALARLEQGAMELAREPVDLARLVNDIIGDADFEARKQGRSLRCSASAGASIAGDPRWLKRALENVIRNALRHTPEGSAVEVELQSTASAIEIAIRDHGPGLPESSMEHLFKPFWRGAQASGSSDGFGLGMAIAREVIQAHDGEISASNAEDGGLIVRIRLPRKDVSDPAR